MRERILLAPGANPTELLRSMAAHGTNTFALRVTDGAGLAQLALLRSGITEKYTFLSAGEEAAVIRRLLPDDSGLTAAMDIAAALRSLRKLIPDNESEIIADRLPLGTFSEKNQRLAEYYRGYMAFCANPAEGSLPYLDGIALMRLAIAKASPVDAELITLREFPLSPLEQALVLRLSPEPPSELTLAQLYGKKTAAPKIAGITAAYGRSNEAEDILGQIYEKKLPLDSCTIAVTNTSAYSQIFYDYALRFDLPVTFGCGVPITNSAPARLLKLYIFWVTHGYMGIDALNRMIMSDCFDRSVLKRQLDGICPDFSGWSTLIETTGSLRLGNPDSAEEDSRKASDYRNTLQPGSEASVMLDCAEFLGAELRRGAAYFVCTYARIRHGHPLTERVDLSARTAIDNTLNSGLFDGGLSPEETETAVMGKSVCCESSMEGHLHVTGMHGALCSPRFNLFAAGLDADDFPGKPTENYLLLDEDYLLVCAEEDAPSSYYRVNRRKTELFDLADTAAALDIPLYLSYPSIELASHSELTPSASLYELYVRVNGAEESSEEFDASLRNAGFFDHTVSASSAIGSHYLRGTAAAAAAHEEHNCAGEINNLERSYSPTAVNKYIQCPRMFYLNVLLGLKEPEASDPSAVITPLETGTMIHLLMEEFASGKPEREKFIERAEQLFALHLAAHPPMNAADVPAVHEDFMRIVQSAYEDDPWNEVILAEASVSTQLANGLRLAGQVDRVERLPSGETVIADFKTSRMISHKENDIASCMQALLYARMMEDSGQPVSGCEFRYLRHGKSVSCVYDSNTKAELEQLLDRFTEALKTGDFPADDSSCKNCPVFSICGKGKKGWQ